MRIYHLDIPTFGRIIEVGSEVTEFAVGDRVVSNGCHAEFVSIPKNLVSKIPDDVSDTDTFFTVLGQSVYKVLDY